MSAIIRREIKNYLKNPLLWVGILIVTIGVYKDLSPYLEIHYFESDHKIENIGGNALHDVDIMDGYIPSSPERQLEDGYQIIRKTLIEELDTDEKAADEIVDEIRGMNPEEASEYLEKYDYYGAMYAFEDAAYHQGSVEEVNDYMERKLENHAFTYYFARKFADFAGLYMGFFATIFLSFLFLQDTRKNTYELLHTKPVPASQYVLGKIGGGFAIMVFVLIFLNLVFMVLSLFHGIATGFLVNPFDFIWNTCIYVLPNMLMIVSVYAIVALVFKNPLPAVPLLILYMVYSNMGSVGPDGRFDYYGRPLAIMVRFPGDFFEVTPPPYAGLNQVFLVVASVILMVLATSIWKRRRVY